jgi:hypothetical protein
VIRENDQGSAIREDVNGRLRWRARRRRFALVADDIEAASQKPGERAKLKIFWQEANDGAANPDREDQRR